MMTNDAAVAAMDGVFLYMGGLNVLRNVTRVRIHHSVEHIPAGAFQHCFALVEVDLHEGLQSIGQWAFFKCISLLRINIPMSVISIGYDAFFNCTALVEVELNEGLQRIEGRAFYRCSSLLSIIIPASVTSIGSEAFRYCTALVQVELHEGLQRIGYEAFCNCFSLLRIIIPSSITSICNDAFARCVLLRNVAISSTSAITQAQFANSFPTIHHKEITLELIKGRFDDLSMHRLYNNYNPAPGTQAKVHARCDTFIQAVNQHPIHKFQHQDCLGMTPLHIMLCSGTDHDIRVIQCMIEKCPDALLIQDGVKFLLTTHCWARPPLQLLTYYS
jgi:hypothetical protein